MRLLRDERGAAMLEYVLVSCVVAIAALLVAGVFGTNIRNLFKSANQSMVAGQASQQTMQDQGATKDVRVSDFKD